MDERLVPSTLTVTNNHSFGPGSLQAEIAAAQSGDTIVFSSTLFGSSTTLSSALVSRSTKSTGPGKNGHGKPQPPPSPPPPPPTPTITLTTGELLLTKNLTIQGPGAGQLNVTGSGGNERAFEVAQSATVTLSGLTISGTSSYWASSPNSAAWDGYGGGILNHGTLTVSACTVSGDIFGNNTEGGGIFSDGTLILSGSTVSNGLAMGDATCGGGVSNWGTATLANTVISSNSANPGDLSYPWFNQGGGIVNRGTLTLNGCTVSGNNARTAGGGIFNGGTLILNGSAVLGNSSGYGGGVYNAGALTLENASHITGNGATYGGDVDNLGVLNSDGTTTIGTLDSVAAALEPGE